MPKTRDGPQRITLTIGECAQILGVSRSTAYSIVRKAVDSGEPFKVMRLGRQWLVNRSSFEDFLSNNGLIDRRTD